jgi:hypothetical protein
MIVYHRSVLWKQLKIKNFVKIIGIFRLLGSVFYFLHIIFGETFYENHNPVAQSISDLTADGSPSKNIVIIFSLFYGIFTVIFSINFLYFGTKTNKIVDIGSCIFCAMTIIYFFKTLLFLF